MGLVAAKRWQTTGELWNRLQRALLCTAGLARIMAESMMRSRLLCSSHWRVVATLAEARQVCNAGLCGNPAERLLLVGTFPYST